MTSDLVLLQLVMSLVAALSGFAMILLWSLNRSERGPGCWALAGLVGGGLFPLYSLFGDYSMFFNMAASLSAMLLLLEGILRFRRFGGEKLRKGIVVLGIVLFSVLSYVNRSSASSRCLVNDGLFAAMLLLMVFALLYGTRGTERRVYLVVALPSLLFSAVMAYRWHLALSGEIGPTTHPYSKIVFLVSIPWMLSWTYGLTLAAMFRARQQIAEQARRDPLTELANRRRFDEALDGLLRREGTSPFALLLLDLNGFKAINDLHGHSFGDGVLRLVASILKEAEKEGDLAVRFGGDEFVLLSSSVADGAGAASLKGALCETLETERLLGGHPLRLRASIGIALFPHDGRTADELLHVADARMYEEKRGAPSTSLFAPGV